MSSKSPGAPPVKLSGPWLQAAETQELFSLFEAAGHKARFVGGVVRNALLDVPVSDLDVATDAEPETVMQLLEAAGHKAIGTGLKHGTVTAVVRGHVFEITTLRIDVETHGRHATVAFTGDWREDAARRDFTMNALYADGDGSLFDPLGGYPDLQARRVRFIGSADARIKEDYLRILRFFRFTAQYGQGEIDREGLSACVRLHEGLRGLSAERIRAELVRLLVAPRAHEILKIMFNHGFLPQLLGTVPEMSRLAHWLSLEQALGMQPEPMMRLGALGVLTVEDAQRLHKHLRLSNKEAARLKLWAKPLVDFAKLEERELRRASYRLGENFQALVAIDWLLSETEAGDPAWRNAYDLPDRWQRPDFKLKGQDLIDRGVPPGPSVGKQLKQLEQRWIDSDFELSQDALLSELMF